MTELNEKKRQGSVGVWRQNICQEEEKKVREAGTSADANKTVGVKQRRSASLKGC